MAQGRVGLKRRPLIAVAALAATAGGAAWRRIGDAADDAGPPAVVIGTRPELPSLPLLRDPARPVPLTPQPAQSWLLVVWASWCGPCRDEHPVLHEIAAGWPRLPLVGLAFRDDPRDAEEWLLRHGNPYRLVALDRDGLSARALGSAGLPASFVFDRHGTLRWARRGGLSRALWQREVVPLMPMLLAAKGGSAAAA